jgi:hypothetical protein
MDSEPDRPATDAPWLGMRYQQPHYRDFWEGHTESHERVTAPYDVEWLELFSVHHLFVWDDEVTYPVNHTHLRAYLDRPAVAGYTGTLLIATALHSRKPELNQLGTDVALSLLDSGLLGPRALGEAFGVLGAGLVLPRLAKALGVLAMEHPGAIMTIVDTLLPGLDRGHRGVFALLELAADLCERGAGTLSPPARQWLGGFTGSSKAAKAAARLVK